MLNNTSVNSLFQTPMSSQIQNVYKINRKVDKENQVPNNNHPKVNPHNTEYKPQSILKPSSYNKKHNFNIPMNSDLKNWGISLPHKNEEDKWKWDERYLSKIFDKYKHK